MARLAVPARSVLAVLVAAALPAAGQETLAPDTLKALKAATVRVDCEAGQAAGFLFRVEGGIGVVAVAGPPAAADKGLTVVFNPGQKDERSLPAERVAVEPEHGIALVRVGGKLPKPIDGFTRPVLGEKAAVFLLGFSATNDKARPASAVVVLRPALPKGPADEAAAIPLDAAVLDLLIGGPVVDTRGRLVGIAVQPAGQRRGAIRPRAELIRMLAPRSAGVTLKLDKAEAGQAELSAEVTVLDPLKKVTKAWVRVARKDAVKWPVPVGKDGTWPTLADGSPQPLKVNPGVAGGKVVAKARPADKDPVEYLVQPVLGTADGKTIPQPAVRYRLDFAKGTIEPVDPPKDAVAGGPTPKEPAAGVKPPALTGIADAGPARPVADIQVHTETIGGPGDAPACLFWADDKATAFYFLDGAGSVRRLTFPDLKEDAVQETGEACSWLSPSAAGPLLTLPKNKEVWVLDAKTLRRKATIKAPGVQRAVCWPKATAGYGWTGEPYEGSGFSTVGPQNTQKFQGGGVTLTGRIQRADSALAPDGKSVFAAQGSAVMRLVHRGTDLAVVDNQPLLVRGRLQSFCFSADGKYVAVPSEGGNILNGVPAKISEWYTYVFPVADLKNPVLKLETGMSPHAIGFDLKSGLLYAENLNRHLIVFDAQGKKLNEFRLSKKVGGPTRTVRQFLVHPDGRKLVVLVSGKPTFPKNGPAVPSELSVVELKEEK